MTGFRLLTVLLLSIVSKGVMAQQLPLFTQYREHSVLINPAALDADYIAFGNNVSFGTSYRKQWTSMPNSPVTQVVRFNYLNDDRRGVNIMVGGHLQNDQTGPTGLTGIYGRIAGVISDDPDFGGFSVGLSFGAVQFRVDPTKVFFKDAEETLGGDWLTKIFPDVGVGIFGYKMLDGGGFFDGDYLYGGVSIPQAFALNLNFITPDGTFSTQRVRHYYANVGMYKYLSKQSFLEPSVWVRYAGGELFSADFNLRYQMPGPLWIGAGYGWNNSLNLEAGLLLGDNIGLERTFKLGYGFGYSFNDIGPHVGNTHELNLSFSFYR